MPKSLRHDGVIPRLWTVVLVVATVCFSNACRKKGQAPAEDAWEVAERERETEVDDAAETRESDDEPELPVPPQRDRPPPDWDGSADAIVHTNEERTHNGLIRNPCLEVDLETRAIAKVRIRPLMREWSLTSADQRHEINPRDYRVKIRFPDFSSQWHEFEVRQPSGVCGPLFNGPLTTSRRSWHVTWGGHLVVVWANKKSASIHLRIFPPGCRPLSPESEVPWHYRTLYAELMFLSADGAHVVRHAVRASPPEPTIGGRIGEVVFRAPAFGGDYCPTPPRRGMDE